MIGEALKAADAPFEYVERPLGDRHVLRAEDWLRVLKATGAFLATHNAN